MTAKQTESPDSKRKLPLDRQDMTLVRIGLWFLNKIRNKDGINFCQVRLRDCIDQLARFQIATPAGWGPYPHAMRHQILHRCLDELLGDFIVHNPGALPSNTFVIRLLGWSHTQVSQPTEVQL